MRKVMEEDAEYLISRLDLRTLEGSKVLVTGSSGLIGSNLILFFNLLLKLGKHNFEVDALSQHESGNVNDFHQGIHFKYGDLSLGTENLYLSKYDFIFHAATYGQPSIFTQKAIETLNLNGPIVIELSRFLNPGGTFVFLSTSEIYSGSVSSPNLETDLGTVSILNPRAPYVYGKLFGEVALLQIKNQYRIRIARIALSYGPGTKLGDSRVLNQLIHRGINERKVELLDSGEAIRSYCYIRDTLEMLLNVAFLGSSEIYNIGGVSQTSIRDLGLEISRILKVSFNIEDKILSYLDSPKQVGMDISKYEAEFGRLDFVELSEGLQRTISWQRSNLFSEEAN
jgi:UDP-glucuronate decarboxylase